MDANLTNIEGLTESELRDLLRNAEKLLQHRIAERAKATLKEARRMAAEVGFEATFKKIAKPTAGVPGKAFAPRSPARQKYRNPENPAETWAGRGRLEGNWPAAPAACRSRSPRPARRLWRRGRPWRTSPSRRRLAAAPRRRE